MLMGQVCPCGEQRICRQGILRLNFWMLHCHELHSCGRTLVCASRCLLLNLLLPGGIPAGMMRPGMGMGMGMGMGPGGPMGMGPGELWKCTV